MIAGCRSAFVQEAQAKYLPEYDEFAQKLCASGATDVEIADFFDISMKELQIWRTLHFSFAESMKVGKDIADTRVERKLYDLAVTDGPHNLGAIKMWLNCRKRGEWSEKASVEMSGPGGEPLMPPTIVVNLVRKGE